ncbi:MAG TPA: SDR family oxidoreductase [Candidatus Angelobacter sp.]|jgi:NAD(P)-dependent dehydrogenase (short-subunit alcohol dehydrogenase family)|nr:SDR family oxidoreductase [Candidatus Angelobacter sp.]
MFTPDLLKGKRVLITGGGTGIGRALAERFLQLGAALYICGRRAEVVEQTAKDLSASTGGYCEAFGLDVRDHDAVEQAIEKIWAVGPLDILVNNAAGNFLAKTETLSARAFDAVIGIVLQGTINLTMACGKRWLAARHPAVVLNIATTYAETGSAFVVPSAVAKAGVLALTRSLAVEWGGRGIRFVAIAPGAIRTEGAFSRLLPTDAMEKALIDHNPLHRIGTLEEISDLATFLVSEHAGYINGEMVYMDGGEMLAGASSFSLLGRKVPDAAWELLKSRKK